MKVPRSLEKYESTSLGIHHKLSWEIDSIFNMYFDKNSVVKFGSGRRIHRL